MRIAFYAPLKPPDHPVPSGDRQVARLLLAALRRGGHEVTLASRLRLYDGVGDPRRQQALADRAAYTADRLVERWRRGSAPELWFTYHLYYKAPDHLGPAICDALGIPYVVAEASVAGKRAAGPWAQNHRAVERALRRAEAVIGLNSADRAGVMPLLAEPGRWATLAPFIDTAAYAPGPREAGPVRLIAVAMMRPGDKLASYRVLGAALARLVDLDWRLEVVGDGPARGEVEAALAPLGDRVEWRGALAARAVAARLAAAGLCVWPAINEAFGMALLEAQASGLPVVAGGSGGVGDIVADGVTGLLVAPGNAEAFAAALGGLIADPARRAAMAAAAVAKARREHDLGAAAARLGEIIAALRRARAA
ncbi:MAG TPA: glycosyltransferase family 4 protein [Stellaceae bacterium]|nr:glycosyltransferase family 4 protein [Stellaceae bacterium]